MLKLNFNLRHQAITLLNPGTIVATDSKNYLVANFNFISDDWEYPLTAVFTSDVEKIPYTILVGQSEELEENECFVPWEVLQSSGNVYVSVFCGDLHTTNTVKFKVVKSGYTEGEIPPPPTPTIYEQILQALDRKQPMLTAGQNITISEENVISASNGSSDYTDLTNKPSINNVTLSGNKSADDLSLQGKLTAGQNITISDDNVISAKGGGVTSYNELTDKPTIIAANSATGYGVSKTLEGAFDFERFLYFVTNSDETSLQIKDKVISQDMLNEDLQRYLFKSYGIPDEYYSDMFISAEHAPNKTGVWYINRTDLEGMPIPAYGYLFNYLPQWRVQIYWTASSNSAENSNRIFFREQYMGGFRDWIELTGGGSQIVSGVVNTNGTITFTDSDGNTFTTTGSSVIGPQGDDYVLTAQDKAEIAGMVDVSGEVDAKINGSIPDYWESAVNTAIGKVKAIQRAHGADCINLVWFSDIHLMASIGNSNYGRNIPALARRLINKLDIPLVVSTGDSATNSVEPTEAAMRADFDYFNELIRTAGISDKLINCYGNHDGAWGDNRQGTEGYLAAYAWHIRPRDYWNDLIRKQTIGADRHYSEDGSYGYVDLPAQKLRIIQLNSFWVGDNDTYYQDGTMIYDYFHHGGYGQDQLDWLADEALHFDEDGWSVLFVAHMPPASIDSTDYTTAANNRDALIMNGILNAYANKTSYQGTYSYNSGRNEGTWANVSVNVDFSSESHYAKPTAFLAGHCHKSRIINDVLPFPIITITCATNSSYDSSTEGSRTNNTATETAFDVISICKDEEKIYLTRLGVGSDRETSYTPISPVINQIPISTDANGNIYNGTGYKDGYRYNSSMGETAAAGYFTTGRIPVKNGDVVALDGFVFPQTTVSGGANTSYCRIVIYKSNGVVNGATSDQVAINYGGTVVDNQVTTITIDTSTAFYSNVEYIAFSGYGSGANAAVYVE